MVHRTLWLGPQVSTANNHQSPSLIRFSGSLSFSEIITEEGTISSPKEGVAWLMTVGRALNTKGVGVGVALKSPTNQQEKARSIRIDYPLSNNQAEYEALITGMQWAFDMAISSLKNLSNSQVVVGQVNSKYGVNSNNLKKYAKKVNLLVVQFEYIVLVKIGRDDNEIVDKLAKITFGEAPNNLGITVDLISHSTSICPIQPIASDSQSWVDELINYILSDILPEDKDKARQI